MNTRLPVRLLCGGNDARPAKPFASPTKQFWRGRVAGQAGIQKPFATAISPEFDIGQCRMQGTLAEVEMQAGGLSYD